MPHARPARPSRFRFGAYELDLRTGELSAAGHRIDVPDQPFAVLSVLLEHAGQLVTREELRARLWPNATPIHFEQGLDYAIRRLREALADHDTSDPEFIETIPRRGYRFVAPVEAVAAGGDDRSGDESGSTPENDAALPAADDRYELLEMIGAGGMGEVYRARDTRLDRDVAVKFLPPWLREDPHALRRFHREAHAAAALNHPNILAVHDLVLLNGAACIVCELLEGRTLREELSAGRLALADVFAYSTQILDGLVAAHEKGIVHRDLKPENVFITDDGPLKILDFGLARLTNPSPHDDSAPTTSVTNRGEVLGTPAYMSPEQAQAEAVDARSDIFSFGVLLYEMLAGERPFAGQTHASVVSAILRDTPRAIEELNPAVPRELSRLIRRCLQKDPRLRFQNTRDLRNELIEIGQEWQAGGLLAVAAPLPAVRRPWLYLLGGVLLVVAIGAVAWVAGMGDWVRARMAGAPTERGEGLIDAPVAVTTAPGWEAQPSLSPDGSVAAYVSNESGQTDVWTVGVAGGNRAQITSDAAIEHRPSWFPDGTAIVFASNRGGSWSIWRAPAPLGGSPSLVLEDGREPAVSPDGTRIAFVRPDREGCRRIHLAEAGVPSSARRLVPVTRGPCRDESWPAWSPDGREIVFAGDRRLWVASLSGGDPRSVTDQGEYDVEPVWADQRTILFSSFRKGTYALWRVPASQLAPPERLTTGAGPERSPSVSQDGRRLAFSSFWENFDLVIRDMKTGQEEAYGTTRNEISPQFSPDGQSVLFAVDRQAGSGTELRLQPLASWKPSGPASQLTVDSGSSSSPQFSPDGKWIAYYRVLDGRRSIWLIASGGGQPVRFGEPPSRALEAADETDPAWSPDGSRLAFVSSLDGRAEVWTAAINNQGKRAGEATRLTSGPGDKELPGWAPDGRWVSFVTGDPASGEVGLVAANGTGQRLLTRGAGAVFARWIPGTNSLAVTGTWGGSRLEVRRVEVSGRTLPSSVPLLEIGEPSDAPMFDISRDGGHIVFCRSRKVGDILVSASRPPR